MALDRRQSEALSRRQSEAVTSPLHIPVEEPMGMATDLSVAPESPIPPILDMASLPTDSSMSPS